MEKNKLTPRTQLLMNETKHVGRSTQLVKEAGDGRATKIEMKRDNSAMFMSEKSSNS
jgi:hypothetical protein